VIRPSRSLASAVEPVTVQSYVGELNATPPTATPVEIQATLENFPFNANPPPTNIATDTFYRTTVAQFVLREFQAAWTVVPTTGATSQFNNWVARALADPTVLDGTNPATSMSFALASTPTFQAVYNVGPNDIATANFINQLWRNTGHSGNANPGLLSNAGVTPVWQVLQAVVTNGNVISSMAPAVANFQDLLLNGGSVPGVSYSNSLALRPGP
jgi:hypothetical protein